MTIGLVGLGLMGRALADRFVAAGHHVIGFDLRPEARQEFVGEAVDSLRPVFERTRLVVLSLPNSDSVEDVIRQAWELLPGARVIDTTTGDPDRTAELGTRLAAIGTDYLDATITGSSELVRRGESVVTVGGQRESYAACEELFRTFAKQSFFVGPWGSGARVKLVVNLVLGLNRAGLAEGLAFAKACGFDQTTVLEILRSGAAYSRAMDSKGPRMIVGDFAPEARLAQHWKDVRLILEAGQKAGAELPLSTEHERLLSSLVAQGFGELDNSCVIRAFQGNSNSESEGR